METDTEQTALTFDGIFYPADTPPMALTNHPLNADKLMKLKRFLEDASTADGTIDADRLSAAVDGCGVWFTKHPNFSWKTVLWSLHPDKFSTLLANSQEKWSIQLSEADKEGFRNLAANFFARRAHYKTPSIVLRANIGQRTYNKVLRTFSTRIRALLTSRTNPLH